jgi:hypothetical protein
MSEVKMINAETRRGFSNEAEILERLKNNVLGMKDAYERQLQIIKTTKIKSKEHVLLILKSTKKAFRDYTDNYDVKDLSKDEKMFIKKLIILWNNYKNDPESLIVFQDSYIDEAFQITDIWFRVYMIKQLLLQNVAFKYRDAYLTGVLSRKDAKKYNTMTHTFITKCVNNGETFEREGSIKATIKLFEQELFMKHSTN